LGFTVSVFNLTRAMFDLTAPSSLKRICNSSLWLHALRLESAATSKIAQVRFK
jgi:hypothetical protein